MVGYPLTPALSQRAFPSAVQSTSAMRDVLARSPLFQFFISLSQSGFIRLQWPHHGARNFTKTVLPDVSASQLASVSSVAHTDAARPSTATAFRAAMAPQHTGTR